MKNLLRPIFTFLIIGSISANAFAQWNSITDQNLKVCGAANDQQDERIAGDGHGGAIIVWEDFRDDASNSGIYIQRVDANGYNKWTAEGKVVCSSAAVNHSAPAIVEDGLGGAIVVWQDWRNGNKDLFAQRIDSSGNFLWTACGVPVVVNSNDQIDPRIISDGANGAIISWQDSSGTDWDIFAQHLNSSGIATWAVNGAPVCIAATDQVSARISIDGANGALITWQDKRNGVDWDIYAQHLSASGSALWANNGIGVCTSAATQNSPKIKTDGSGGAYMAWVDKRNGTDDIYAQRLNSSGAATWTSNGSPVCIASGNQKDFDIVVNFVDGMILSWADKRNSLDYDIYAQKINPTGSAQWATDGIPVTTAVFDQSNLDMTDDNAGGVIISWVDSSAGNLDIFTQRVNSSGAACWGMNGQVLANAANNQTRVKTAGDGSGGVLMAFQDKRTGSFDLYAMHVTSAGIRSSINEDATRNIALKAFPQPASTIVQVQLPSEFDLQRPSVVLFNELGERVSAQFVISLENHTLIIGNPNEKSGLYLVMLNDGINCATQRILFVK